MFAAASWDTTDTCAAAAWDAAASLGLCGDEAVFVAPLNMWAGTVWTVTSPLVIVTLTRRGAGVEVCTVN